MRQKDDRKGNKNDSINVNNNDALPPINWPNPNELILVDEFKTNLTLLNLPNEILLEIGKYLKLEDLLNFRGTAKKFSTVFSQDERLNFMLSLVKELDPIIKEAVSKIKGSPKIKEEVTERTKEILKSTVTMLKQQNTNYQDTLRALKVILNTYNFSGISSKK